MPHHKYSRLDLDEIAAELGEHFNKYDMDDYTAQCTLCGEDVDQTMNECPSCNLPVVWFNSRVWERLHGSPRLRRQELELVKPTGEIGKLLCSKARMRGFRNQTEADIVDRAERTLGLKRCRDIVNYVTRDKRGRPAISHAINTFRKAISESSGPVKDRDELESPTARI